MRRGIPYLAGLAGVVAITLGLGLLRGVVAVPSLVVAYVVLVIWVGARWGWLPGAATAILAFLVYDIFLVPPYGSLAISAPRELLDLVVLLVAALAGARLVGVLAERRAGAEERARESRALFEVASSALRQADPKGALALVAERARAEADIDSLTFVASSEGGFETAAGEPPSEAELKQVRWVLDNGLSLGARLHGETFQLFQQEPPAPAYVLLPGGVAIVRPAARPPGPEAVRRLGALLGLAALVLDRLRAIAEAERARTLEESDRLKTALLSSLSHELRSPIASLRAGLGALAMRESGLGEQPRVMLQGLDEQAARLDRLVRDLLIMSRLEAGGQAAPSPQDLADLVGGVLRSMAARLQAFQVEVDIPPDLPPVSADELQLERVIANLLENAIDFTRPAGRITVAARRRDGEVEAWVENEGEAIPPADLDAIFEKFWTRRRGGSGLGLAICRRIIEASGGTITARNTRAGPRFTFRLPAWEPAVR